MSIDDRYQSPQDILDDPSLTREDKIKLLQQWEYDQREMEVAESENMQSDEDMPEFPESSNKDSGDLMQEIHDALQKLQESDK